MYVISEVREIQDLPHPGIEFLTIILNRKNNVMLCHPSLEEIIFWFSSILNNLMTSQNRQSRGGKEWSNYFQKTTTSHFKWRWFHFDGQNKSIHFSVDWPQLNVADEFRKYHVQVFVYFYKATIIASKLRKIDRGEKRCSYPPRAIQFLLLHSPKMFWIEDNSLPQSSHMCHIRSKTPFRKRILFFWNESEV